MKKAIFSMATMLVVMGTLVSCKKDYSCECTGMGTTNSVKMEKVSKSDAKKACESLETQSGGILKCSLK